MVIVMITFINYMNYSLSVIIPVYMEAENIRDAVKGAMKATENAGIKEYEIIIIDCLRKDGSHDGTPDIADEIASITPKVRVIHNKSYVNLGYKYFQGVRNAKYDYVTWIPGDNENLPESITETYKLIGKADVVVPYTSNMEVRPFFRQAVSRLYTFANNLIFGLKLNYYNGLCVYKRNLLQAIPEITDSFAFAAEILIYFLKSGASYIEIPIKIKAHSSKRKSSAFNIKNTIGTIKAIIKLFWNVRIKKKRISVKK